MWTIKVYSPTILFHMHVSHPFLYISVCYYLRIHIREIRRRRDDRSKKQYRVDRQGKKSLFLRFYRFPFEESEWNEQGMGTRKVFFPPLDPLELHPHTQSFLIKFPEIHSDSFSHEFISISLFTFIKFSVECKRSMVQGSCCSFHCLYFFSIL